MGTSISGTIPQELCSLSRSGNLQVVVVDCDRVSCPDECGCVCFKSQVVVNATGEDVQERTPKSLWPCLGGSE